MEVYCDSSFADAALDRYKSTGGYIISLNKTAIAWKTRKIKWVCSSSSQAEYLALYLAAKEAVSLGYLIEDYFNEEIFPIKIYCDNLAVITTIMRDMPTELNKFLSTKYYITSQWQKEGIIDVVYVPSKHNIADMFTKSLGCNLFESLRGCVLKERRSIRDDKKTGRSIGTGIEPNNNTNAQVERNHDKTDLKEVGLDNVIG